MIIDAVCAASIVPDGTETEHEEMPVRAVAYVGSVLYGAGIFWLGYALLSGGFRLSRP